MAPQLLVLPALVLDDEESNESSDGESREARSGDNQGRVLASDALDLEDILRLGSVRGLPVGQLLVRRVDGVGPHEEDSPGDLFAHLVGQVTAGRAVGLRRDREGASLVFGEIVLGLPPAAVLLAGRRVAELQLDLLVTRVRAGREAPVQRPLHRDRVLARAEHCRGIG